MKDVFTIWRFLSLTDDFNAFFCTLITFLLNLREYLSLILKTDCYEEGTNVNGSCCSNDCFRIMWKQHKEG